ncbi:MAG: glycosyltransferase family 2 protein [Fusobacteriaceae bacterium]
MIECKELKVSIIIPAYNVEKYIYQCIKSVSNQSYKNLEIILVNDGSTDKSLEIIEKCSVEDKRIKITTKKNGGLSSARNKGIEEATGDYIFNLDGDDFLDSDTIENLVNEVLKSKDLIDVVVGNLSLVFGDDRKKIWIDSNLEENKIYSGKDYLEKYFFVGKACYSSCNKLWKRDLYIKNNIWHPLEISLGEDSNTVVRLMSKAKNIIKLNKSVYNYRMNPQSMTKVKAKKILQYEKSIKLLDEYFLENSQVNFFKKYRLSYLFFSLYVEVLTISNKEIVANEMDDYSIVKKMFLNDLEKISKEKIIRNHMSGKLKILLKMYLFNPLITEFVLRGYKKLKRRN